MAIDLQGEFMMPSVDGCKPIVRAARPSDNAALLALARSAPMRGHLEVCADRSPDFFAFSQLQGESSIVWIAEHSPQTTSDSRLIGCTTEVQRHERIGGEATLRMHVGDMRVDPNIRRSAIGTVLAGQLRHRFAASDCTSGSFEVIGGNEAALRGRKAFEPEMKVFLEDRLNLWQIPLWRNYRAGPWLCRQATWADLPQLEDLLNASYKHHRGHPDFSPIALQNHLNSHPSFSINDIWLAEKNKRVLACLGLWVQEGLRTTIVQRLTPQGRAVLAGLSLAKPILKLADLPQKGSPLRFGFLRYLAHAEGMLQPLQSLVRYVATEYHHQRQLQFFALALATNDPLNASLKGLWKLSLPIHLFQFTRPGPESSRLEKQWRHLIPYTDLALV